MKAVIFTKYGHADELRLIEIETPTPKDKEVRVKIHATTVTIGDVIVRSGKHPDSKFYSLMLHLVFGIRKPRNQILGMEFAGEIESLGKDVTKFKKGEKVFGSTFSSKFGSYAEYKCFHEDGMLITKPKNISYGESATISGGGMTALNCLRKGKVNKGKKVLIIGASGAVGTNAVQLAKYFGAVVTGVCSTPNLTLVKSLGADHVIDYTKENITSNGEKYELIFDAVAKVSKRSIKSSLARDGVYINVLKHSGNGEKIDDLRFLKKLVEQGDLKPVIDRQYSFEEIVEAHKYVEKGHKKGNVVINIIAEEES